jgi:anti-sigma-K factor RskA
MNFQFDMFSSVPPRPASIEQIPVPAGTSSETADLLRQILEVQREQLVHLQASSAAHDTSSRWRAFLARWRDDFSELPEACRQAVPILERTYGKLIGELTDHLCQSGDDALENDFALQEFLDRYGMRLAQLGTILNLVAPLAEAESASEST